VVDISATGVGLLIDRPIEPETLLEVQLQGDGSGPAPTLLVEVRHVQARPDGGWLVGCAFGRALSASELQALLW
jgi:hypothetical protein